MPYIKIQYLKCSEFFELFTYNNLKFTIMKLTRIYKNQTEFCDSSKDKIKIEMNTEEFIRLTTLIQLLDKFELFKEQTKELIESFEKAEKTAKIKWVK